MPAEGGALEIINFLHLTPVEDGPLETGPLETLENRNPRNLENRTSKIILNLSFYSCR